MFNFMLSIEGYVGETNVCYFEAMFRLQVYQICFVKSDILRQTVCSVSRHHQPICMGFWGTDVGVGTFFPRSSMNSSTSVTLDLTSLLCVALKSRQQKYT